MSKVGILIHGRHLQAVGWEKLVWGEPPHKLGTLPMAVLVALTRGPENIGVIVMGTGASEKNGLKEAEYAKKFLVDHMAELQDFEVIRRHPRFQSTRDIASVTKLFSAAICELRSQNTVEEIANASSIFAGEGIGEVIQVTCASHAPRCIRDAAVAQEKGLIPPELLFSVVRDHMVYAGTSAGDIAIMEPPHRGDDRMLGAPILPHMVFPKLYKIPFEKRIEILQEIDGLLARAMP